MYAKDIGAARVLQAEPQRNGNVFAYTVTYWAKGKSFPLGAYYNDIPDETALYFPDSLRTAVGADGRRPVLVEAVVAGTPAEAAGLRQGELLVAVDGSSLAGTADLDERIAQLAGREATLTVWGLAGLRETTCTLGPRFVGAEGHGVEGLYYNRPWEFNDYANYQQYSQAFTQAWNDSIAAYRQAQEQSRRDAQLAYLGSEVSYLEGRIDELEHSPSHRDSRTLREQVSSSLEHRYKTDFDKWIGGD
jgi:membrane-associated protease RseP (regulator of RpoE activity)